MNSKEFEDYILQEPLLLETLSSTAKEIQPRTRGMFGTPSEIAAIVVLFPVVVFIIKRIGLPWLYEVARYSEIWRREFHDWVDAQARKHGIEPDELEKTGEALRKKLEDVTDKDAREAWERFAEVVKKGE
jgi:hypothetical protein